jgi:SAM-dependent methyltransferase
MRTFFNSVFSIPWFFYCLAKIKKQKRVANVVAVGEFPIKIERLYPCFNDRFDLSGTANGQYFHQDLLVARRIFMNAPKTHYDVGSSVSGFVAHLAVFRVCYVLDIRPLQSKTENIVFQQQDFIGTLKDSLKECCDSLSCLHALEHFGLGRYGDPVDYEGHLKGLKNLYLMLKPGGKFYFSVPIGEQRIEFNAHRVFSVNYLLKLFSDKYDIENFSFVDGNGDLHENVELKQNDVDANFGCSFGLGIFEMRKK